MASAAQDLWTGTINHWLNQTGHVEIGPTNQVACTRILTVGNQRYVYSGLRSKSDYIAESHKLDVHSTYIELYRAELCCPSSSYSFIYDVTERMP